MFCAGLFSIADLLVCSRRIHCSHETAREDIGENPAFPLSSCDGVRPTNRELRATHVPYGLPVQFSSQVCRFADSVRESEQQLTLVCFNDNIRASEQCLPRARIFLEQLWNWICICGLKRLLRSGGPDGLFRRIGYAYPYRYGSTRDSSTLVPLSGRHHLDRPALFLQPGECPLHENGGRHHETQSLREHDDARDAVVPLERHDYRICGFLVLGPDPGRA